MTDKLERPDDILTSVTFARDAFGDPRFEYLAELCGFADADHARGKIAKLWSVCTALKTVTPPISRIVVCLGPKGPDALITADLGERVADDPGRIRMKGCERFAWYKQLQHAHGGKARASGAQRQKGRFAAATPAADQQPTSGGPAADQQPPAADQQPEPAGPPDGDPLVGRWTSGPAQDQDQDPDPPESISIVPAATRHAARSRTPQDTPIVPSLLPEGWKPADTPKNREHERQASECWGVVVAYALDKFVARMSLEGRLSRNWDAEWRLFLTSEFPTPEQIRDGRGRADREASARAARDRERAEIAERDRRANEERDGAREVLAAFLAPPEKATA